MLIEKNLKDKNKSKYCCDRCREELTIENKIGLYIQLPYKKIKKRWDLCKRCFRLLIIGIEKKNKKEENK